MKFREQHAIITGDSSGIGKATAKLLASQGAHISIVGRTDGKLSHAKIEIERAFVLPSQQVFTWAADVSDRASAEQAMENAIGQMGPPDLLINSAGMAHPGYFQSLEMEIF